MEKLKAMVEVELEKFVSGPALDVMVQEAVAAVCAKIPGSLDEAVAAELLKVVLPKVKEALLKEIEKISTEV